MVRKYWNYKRVKPMKYAEIPGPTLPLRNSPEPFHTVTHRAIGDIPGCTPAPRSGLHLSEPLDAIQINLYKRHVRFLEANALSGIDKQAYFSGDHFNEKLFGAYGEKL